MLPLASLPILVSLISRKIVAANGLSYTDNLVIDSGSANTWIGPKYRPTSTSVNTHLAMKMDYIGENTFAGMTYKNIIS